MRPHLNIHVLFLGLALFAAASARAQPQRPSRTVEAPPAQLANAETLRKAFSVPVLGAGELDAAWEAWRTAPSAADPAAEKAWLQLLRLKEDFGISSLDAYGTAMARASDTLRERGDTTTSLQLAEKAVALAPSLPLTHLTLARSLVSEDPSAVGQASGELLTAGSLLLADPRFARPLIADLAGIFFLALLGTALAVVSVLFARRIRYAHHDFHHLFPKAAARWQSAAALTLLLSLPLVLRLGLLPLALTLFAAVALYLRRSERVVAALLLVLVALVPLAIRPIAAQTVFAGSVDEDVYLVERGGLDAEPAAQRIEERRKEERAKYEELFALAHLHQRRGRLAEAIAVYKEAAQLKSGDAWLASNLGAALLATGDSAGAEALLQNATSSAPKLAEAWANLSVLHTHRSAVLEGDPSYVEANKAEKARDAALALNPSLAARLDRVKERGAPNRVLSTVSLPVTTLAQASATLSAERVEAQLAALINGASGLMATLLLIALILGAAAFGALALPLRASRGCEKCGRPACRRCDREVGLSGVLCAQCVTVFTRAASVAAPIKVRKQAEVANHQWLQGRISSALGLLCSGAGHLFLGAPVRGALFAFLFFFALVGLGLREGLVRVPFGAVPWGLKLVPLVLLLVAVYALSFLSLRKRLPRDG